MSYIKFEVEKVIVVRYGWETDFNLKIREIKCNNQISCIFFVLKRDDQSLI